MLRTVCILVALVLGAYATCTPGKDGRDMTLTASSNAAAGCTTIQTTSMADPVVVCNATAGALNIPTDTVYIESMAPLCQLLTTDAGDELTICDGATGATGATGAAGATGNAGVAATITVPAVTTGSFLAANAPALGRSSTYALLAAAGIASTGTTTIVNGDIGSYPTGTVTGFPPGVLLANGVVHTTADLATANAHTDAGAAFLAMQSTTCTDTVATAADIGGTTMTAGVHCYSSSLAITGKLTLTGNLTSVFVFVVSTTLTTAASASIVLLNNVQPCNVFFAVGTSATIGSGTSFAGNILAATSVSLGSGVTTTSRVMAGLVFPSGAITLQSGTIATQGVYCNGTVTVNSTCASVVSGAQTLQLCSGTSPLGPTGARGVVGIQGPGGLNGTTGATGPAGFMGTIPGVIPVDGTVYPPTRAGIQAAMNAVATLGPLGAEQYAAVVSVSASVLSDGTALSIPNYVTLDFNGNTYSMLPNASSYDLVTAMGSAPTASSALTVTSNEGSNTVTVSTANAGLYIAGDMVYLSGGTSHGVAPGGSSTVRAAAQANLVTLVNSGTGVLTLKDPLAFDFASGTATIARVAAPSWGAVLRNAVLNANGNTGALSRLCVFENVMFAQISNVKVTGVMTTSQTATSVPTEYQYRVAGIYVNGAVSSSFFKLSAIGFTVAATARDIGLALVASSTIRVLRSHLTQGLGPALIGNTYTTVHGVISLGQLVSGLEFDTCAYCTLTSLQLSGQQNSTNGNGLLLAYGSHNNAIRGVIATANKVAGIAFYGDGDNYNQIKAVVAAWNQGSTPVRVGTVNANPVGNYFAGKFDKAPALFGSTALSANTYHAVGNPNGHYIYHLNGALPNAVVASDFPSFRSLIMNIVVQSGVDQQVGFNLLTGTAAVRRGALTLS